LCRTLTGADKSALLNGCCIIADMIFLLKQIMKFTHLFSSLLSLLSVTCFVLSDPKAWPKTYLYPSCALPSQPMVDLLDYDRQARTGGQVVAPRSPGVAHHQIGREALLRTRLKINDGWKFLLANAAGADNPAHNAATWTTVNLPHTWNVEDTLDDEPGYHRGIGWYRRTLNLGSRLQGKRLFLYFEGANQVAEVYVNGELAGRHGGGYTAFAFEITDYVRFDVARRNVIAVKVDNRHNKDIPPLNADFNFYGGIYRDVWLIATSPIHLTLLDHASSGVYVDTPRVSDEKATVRVRGLVINSTHGVRQVEVTSIVIDREGRRVTTLTSKFRVGAKGQGSFEQTSAPIVRPQLWSPDQPYLYKVRTVVRHDGRSVDEVVSPLGFRWFSFDADRGFFLNGKHLKLRGTNRHQDYAGMGNAVPDTLQARDLEIIKDTGFNFLRLAHYPQDPSVLKAADRLGLILWEEIPLVNQITVSAEFTQNSERMLTEMIRQHYNHPSVVLWGYMNEVFLGPKMEQEQVRETVKLARTLEEVCHREDPGRVTTIAFDYGARDLYNTSGIGDVPQVVGWNLYHGWYYEEFSDFGKFLDEQHRLFPRRPLIVSEYGANGDTRLHSLAPKRYDSTIEWQRRFHEAYLPQINARPFIAGSAIWNQFDFGSEFRGETIPHINQKGMFTFDRQPKDTHYFYKAHLSRRPVVHIATRNWLYRAGADTSAAGGSGLHPVLQTFDVYTNLPAVELFHNRISLGRRTVDESRRVSWDVPLRDGPNTLIAKGAHEGRPVSDRVEIHFSCQAAVLNDHTVPFRELAVNVGSNAQFIDQRGQVWAADQPYRPGSWGYIGSETTTTATSRNVLNTAEDPLYQTVLEGLATYRFDVPDGDYEMELRFVEYKFSEPRQRVFGIVVNSRLLIEQLDLAKEYGTMQAISRRFRVRASERQGIRIDFKPVVSRTLLSAIRIQRIPEVIAPLSHSHLIPYDAAPLQFEALNASRL